MVAQIGNILSTNYTYSTSVKVTKFHLFASGTDESLIVIGKLLILEHTPWQLGMCDSQVKANKNPSLFREISSSIKNAFPKFCCFQETET